IAGGVSIGDDAGIGLSAVVTSIDRTVKAYLGANTIVNVYGGGSGNLDAQGHLLAPGLTVDAQSNDQLLQVAGGGAGSNTFAGAGSAVITILNSTTDAFIDHNALVNQSVLLADPDQSVLVRANHNTFIIDVAGNVGIGETAAVGLAADISA